jgi:hypothetical protein
VLVALDRAAAGSGGTLLLAGEAGIGKSLLFPILKRQNESLALGIVSLLAVVTLRQDFAGAAGGDPGSFVTVGRSLVAIHDWTFLLGPGFIVGVGNGLILGYLMYRSGLVPRRMALLGLIAGPVLCAGGIAALLGVIEPDSALKNLAAAPEFVWELSLGIYLMVKGFRPSPITAETTADTTSSAPRRIRHLI